MTHDAHKQIHAELHEQLDKLIADFLEHHPGTLISRVSLMDFMRWSAEQAQDPTPGKEQEQQGGGEQASDAETESPKPGEEQQGGQAS